MEVIEELEIVNEDVEQDAEEIPNRPSQDENRPKVSFVRRIWIQRWPWWNFLKPRLDKFFVFIYCALVGVPVWSYYMHVFTQGIYSAPAVVGYFFCTALLIMGLIYFERFLTGFPPFWAWEDGVERVNFGVRGSAQDCTAPDQCQNTERQGSSTRSLHQASGSNELTEMEVLSSSTPQPASTSDALEDASSAGVSSPTEGIEMHQMAISAEVYVNTSDLSSSPDFLPSKTMASTSTCEYPSSAVPMASTSTCEYPSSAVPMASTSTYENPSSAVPMASTSTIENPSSSVTSAPETKNVSGKKLMASASIDVIPDDPVEVTTKSSVNLSSSSSSL